MLKILLVEDNALDAHLTQDILAEWSIEQFEVTHVTRLSEAFIKLARTRFDAILLDLSLPEDNVLQICPSPNSLPVAFVIIEKDFPNVYLVAFAADFADSACIR